MKRILLACLSVLSVSGHAQQEWDVKGLVDVRAGITNSNDSYVKGGLGKFRYSDGQHLSVALAGLELGYDWDENFSAKVIANAYLDGEDDALGVTEAFIKYQGLPNESGYRWSARGGVFYPHISLEHGATAWTPKYTLTASTLNTWIGEEIRVAGLENKITRLGRFHNNDFDLSLTATVFMNNDPAGALLAWHGWTQSARQTLWTESRPFAKPPSDMLEAQADASDPFLEIDKRPGYHVVAEWRKRGVGQLSWGYYNNRAKPYIVKHGQYGWKTRFYHLGARFLLPGQVELIAQYLNGDTLMQSPQQFDVVNAHYASGYVMLSRRWQAHRLSLRAEEFSVDDRDQTLGDNNNEYGKAATATYQYRPAKQWFVSLEYNWMDTWRPGRHYWDLPVNQTERQTQLSLRYFF